jgi:hypothetical protein
MKPPRFAEKSAEFLINAPTAMKVFAQSLELKPQAKGTYFQRKEVH